MRHKNEIALSSSLLGKAERLLSLDGYLRFSISLLIVRKLRYIFHFPILYLSNLISRLIWLRPLAKASGLWADSEALVIGSGPSTDLLDTKAAAESRRRNGLKIVVSNNFFRSSQAEDITPDVYVLRDIAFLPDGRLGKVWEWLTARKSVFVAVPVSWRKLVKGNIEDSRIYFFEDNIFPLQRKRISPVRIRSYMATTGVVSLAIAQHFSPRHIHVIGLDLNHYAGIAAPEGKEVASTVYCASLEGQNDDDQYFITKPLGVIDVLQASANQLYFLDRDFGHLRNVITNLNPNPVFGSFPTQKEHIYLLNSSPASGAER